jgi:hypothetical protein
MVGAETKEDTRMKIRTWPVIVLVNTSKYHEIYLQSIVSSVY